MGGMGQKQVPVMAAVIAAVIIIGGLGFYFLRGNRDPGTNPYESGKAPYAPGKSLPSYMPGGEGKSRTGDGGAAGQQYRPGGVGGGGASGGD